MHRAKCSSGQFGPCQEDLVVQGKNIGRGSVTFSVVNMQKFRMHEKKDLIALFEFLCVLLAKFLVAYHFPMDNHDIRFGVRR
jgi:hypothetical protein